MLVILLVLAIDLTLVVQPIVPVVSREELRFLNRLRLFDADVEDVEKIADGAVIGDDALVVCDERLNLTRPGIGELLLNLQDLEVRGHAVFVAFPFGVEVFLGRVARST